MVKLNAKAHPKEINNSLIQSDVTGVQPVDKKPGQCVNVLYAKVMLFAALGNGINNAALRLENSIAVNLIELIRIFHSVNPFYPRNLRAGIINFINFADSA